MKKNLVVAGLFGIVIALWLASGLIFKVPEQRIPTTAEAVDDRQVPLVKVRVRPHTAEQRTVSRVLRGKTQVKHTARVSTEISGRVIARPVERGDKVMSGDVLCQLSVDDRQANVDEAEAKLAQAKIDKQGALELKKRNLLSGIQLARVEAELAAAEAALSRQRLTLAKTRVTAPFSGIVESLPMMVGDLAAPGSECATLIDLDPLLITASIAERDIDLVSTGLPVTAQTSTDAILEGIVTFIGSLSDSTTRMYPAEITVPNPDYRIKAGLTTLVTIQAESVMAHRVSSGLLTLDDDGVIGLRAVDAEDRVVFHPITIIEDALDGTWVTGLPSFVDLITVGHEFVSTGQLVDVVRDDLIPSSGAE